MFKVPVTYILPYWVAPKEAEESDREAVSELDALSGNKKSIYFMG